MKKEKLEVKQIKLMPIKVGTLRVKLNGKTPLLMDKMSSDVKDQILAKQTGVAKSNKTLRDLKKEQYDAVHITTKGKIGFPVEGFKRGMMDCTARVGDKFFSKSLVAGAIRIINPEDGLIPIKFKKQSILQHSIKGMTKFTPQFHGWTCELVFKYDENNISPQDIITLINYAGFYVGIGAWRPRGRDGGSGEYGMYEVSTN